MNYNKLLTWFNFFLGVHEQTKQSDNLTLSDLNITAFDIKDKNEYVEYIKKIFQKIFKDITPKDAKKCIGSNLIDVSQSKRNDNSKNLSSKDIIIKEEVIIFAI